MNTLPRTGGSASPAQILIVGVLGGIALGSIALVAGSALNFKPALHILDRINSPSGVMFMACKNAAENLTSRNLVSVGTETVGTRTARCTVTASFEGPK